VNYGTLSNTAVTGEDYGGVGWTPLTFEPGVSSRNVTVTIYGDLKDEDDEDFYVKVDDPTTAAASDAEALITIIDNDPPPTVSIADISGPEGNVPDSSMSFSVDLSVASGKTVTIGYATEDGTATASGGDYTPTSGTLSFAPGVTTQNISVFVQGDTDPESDETFVMRLSVLTT
jgi:hypothetical protein